MKWMSNLNNKLVPILIGISLSTLSLSVAVLLYPMLRKDDDDAKNDNAKKIVTSERKEIICKIPKQFVPAVIGRGGHVINDIRNLTGTYIKVNDDIDSQNCTCIIKGNDMESILLAESLIKEIIDNQPVIETYELFLSYENCWRILKKNVVQMIQRITGVKIIIDKSPYIYENKEKREQRIILKGTAEQIASAVTEIEDIIQEVNKTQAQIKCDIAATAKKMSKSALSPRDDNINNVTSTNGLEPLDIILPDDLMEVYVSAMESPSQFWIHMVGPANIDLQNLVSEMTEYYDKEENRELHALKKIACGQMVAAKFSHDGKWYRAEVILTFPRYEVLFVDYGDKDIVFKENILELRTDMLSLRPQAVECSLANVKPRENEWELEAIDKFAELVSLAEWKALGAKVRSYKKRSGSRRKDSPILCLDLYDENDDKNINIGETLVRLGLAQFDEEICSREFSAVSSTLPRDKCDFPFASSTPLVERVSKPVSPLQPAEAIDTATPEEKQQIEQPIEEICVEAPKEKDEINSLTTSS